MEKRFESLTLSQFQEQFPDGQACHEYLARLKWPDGFVCEKCGHTHYCKGKLDRTRQCTKCGYQATPTSGTLFRKVKFPILKAFYIVYFIATNKQGISSSELSRKLGLRKKTCWSFKPKVMKAMTSSKKHPMIRNVEVDETVIDQEEEVTKGRQNQVKKLVVVGIERKEKGIGRMYALAIEDGINKFLKPFYDDHIDPKAIIKTDEWRGYRPLKQDFPNLEQVHSGKKGNNFPDIQRVIMMLKAWLRGIHHSVHHLQSYLDEYCYRFNRHFMKGEIFNNLINKMVTHHPVDSKPEFD